MKLTPRGRIRKERLDLLRKMLIRALGGVCVDCGTAKHPEIDHVDGCTWDQNHAGRENRLRRFAREFREGVRLTVRCRSCNGSRNQFTHGTRAERTEYQEAPF